MLGNLDKIILHLFPASIQNQEYKNKNEYHQTLFGPTPREVVLLDGLFLALKTKSIASNATTELLTLPLVVEESEILKVQASDANELHVIASILQIQPREVVT